MVVYHLKQIQALGTCLVTKVCFLRSKIVLLMAWGLTLPMSLELRLDHSNLLTKEPRHDTPALLENTEDTGPSETNIRVCHHHLKQP